MFSPFLWVRKTGFFNLDQATSETKKKKKIEFKTIVLHLKRLTLTYNLLVEVYLGEYIHIDLIWSIWPQPHYTINESAVSIASSVF